MIDLIQLRHNYAAEEGLGHVYMPTPLLTVSARLLDAGFEVRLHDENIKPSEITSNIVGINLLGAPYIPEAIKLMDQIDKDHGKKKYLIGGQVVSGLSDEQFKRLFGKRAFNGNDDKTFMALVGIRKLIAPEQTSLIPAYELLDDDAMKEYLSREFSLYVANGCNKACSFCAALNRVPESYRDFKVIGTDLKFLVERAKSFGIGELNIYMSNLDVFQNPPQLLRFARVVSEVKSKYPDFEIKLRGLSTVHSFLKAKKDYPQSILELVKSGFHTVGFGVDGWGTEVWRIVKKGHNTPEKCIDAIRSAKKDFGLTPEILMVFGHDQADDQDSLKAAYEVTKEMVEKYGAVPRPHVSKAFIPGNDDWNESKYAAKVDALLNYPESFQSLDFTALPSELTHSDIELRELATAYYLKMCELPGNTTLSTKPITPGMTKAEITRVKKENLGKFDR